jgi:hypothetical protein
MATAIRKNEAGEWEVFEYHPDSFEYSIDTFEDASDAVEAIVGIEDYDDMFGEDNDD